MPHEKTSRFWLALGILLFALSMTAGALWDLPLDAALHNPHSFIAIFLECFGIYPLYLPTVCLCVCVAIDPARKRWLRIGAGAFGVGVCIALGVYAFLGLRARGARPVVPTVAVWCALAVGLALLLHAKLPLPKLQFICLWGSAYMLTSLALINLLKLLWNRTRFDDMLATGSFAAFTSWLRPLGAGGTSFPSGHTAAACGIFVLVLACDVFPALGRRRLLVWGMCWAYVAGVALTRLIIGRHFLSDTVMAAFVMTVLFLTLTHTKLYRRQLEALRSADAPAQSADAR